MNSSNSHGIALLVLALPLVAGLSSAASAATMPLRTDISALRSLGSSADWSGTHSASAVTDIRALLGERDGSCVTFGALTNEVFDSAKGHASSTCGDVAADEIASNPQATPMSALASRVISSTGAIENDLNAFRALLGNPNNNAAPGEHATGHREINWDGVPAAVTNVFNFPSAFFNTNSPRGLVYKIGGRGLEVSDQRFADINPTYAAEFTPFSGQKLFSPLGKNESDVQFFVAGSNTRAVVNGFGVVFMDVDTLGSTGIEVIGVNGEILARLVAPVRSDARGASFVGVVFGDAVIASVRIVSGNGRLAPNELDISQGGQHDLVVMDDFVYGEPKAILP